MATIEKQSTYDTVSEKVRKLGFRVPPPAAWQKRIGAMKDSAHFDEALRLGAEWRDAENRKAQGELSADP